MRVAVWSLLQQPSFLDVDLQLDAAQCDLLHVLQERLRLRCGVGIWRIWRIANVILYSFYKNMVLYLHQLYYAAFNNWTGQVLFEGLTIGTYNTIFTSIPPIAIGLFERVCLDKTRTENPTLYKETQVRY